MQLSSKSYSSKVHRPSPIEWVDQELRIGLVFTPWIEKEKAQAVFSLGQEILKSGREDDVTQMRTLSGVIHPEIASLKASLVGMHEYIYTNFNTTDLDFCGEAVAFSWDKDGHFYYAKVGQPHLFVTQNSELHPLCYQPDLSSHLQINSPLVFEGLGLTKGIVVQTGEWMLQRNQSVILCSRSHVPTSCLVNFQSMSDFARVLAQSDEDRPFWVGELKGSTLS